MDDFRLCSQETPAALICEQAGEFDDQSTLDTLSVTYLLEKVEQGRAVLDADEHAVAVVRPEAWREVNGNAVLWLLFINTGCPVRL